ncbi:hypothetical protein WAE61_01915 [Comamonadaceae bacterium PP-2]
MAAETNKTTAPSAKVQRRIAAAKKNRRRLYAAHILLFISFALIFSSWWAKGYARDVMQLGACIAVAFALALQ